MTSPTPGGFSGCIERWPVPRSQSKHSVFRKRGTRREIVRLMAEIEPLTNPKCDDIRAYSLLTSGRHAVYGLPSLPDGILLLD